MALRDAARHLGLVPRRLRSPFTTLPYIHLKHTRPVSFSCSPPTLADLLHTQPPTAPLPRSAITTYHLYLTYISLPNTNTHSPPNMSGSDNFNPALSQTPPEPDFSDTSFLDPYLNPDPAVDQHYKQFTFGDEQVDYDGAAHHDPASDAATYGMVNTTTGDFNGNDIRFTFDDTPDLPPTDHDTGSPLNPSNFTMDSYPNLKFDDIAIFGDFQAHPVEPVTSPTQPTPAIPTGLGDDHSAPSYLPAQLPDFTNTGPYPAFPATKAVDQYPSLPELQPDRGLGTRNLGLLRQRTAFQFADAGANDTLGGSQDLPTGDGVLDPRLNGGPPAAEITGGHTSVSGHVNAGEEASPVPPATALEKPYIQLAPHATPSALRTLAPKPQSGSKVANGVAQSTNNGTDPVTPPVLLVKKRAPRAKKEPVDVKQTDTKPSVSKAKQEVVKTPIHTETLLVPTLADAQRLSVTRTTLTIVDDDCEDVAANYNTWIPRITKPFDADFRKEPEDVDHFTPEGKKEFTRWQEEHLNKVSVVLAEHEAKPNDSAAQFAQSCAWVWFQKVLDAHSKGMEHVPSTIIIGGMDTTTKCSTRIETAILALEQYPILRFDLLKQERLDALVANPVGFYRKKVDNCVVNFNKTKKGPAKIKRNEDTKKSKATTKRKAPSPDLSDNESDGDDGTPSDDKGARPIKRMKAGSKRVDSAI
jgi:hypothetical protein